MKILRLVLFVAVVSTGVGVWQWWNSVDINSFYVGKRVIITGASRGLGKSMAVQLARAGARLVISARTTEKLFETARQCQQYGSDVHMVVGDMGSEVDCTRLVQTAVDKLGGVDILIVNAVYTHEPTWFVHDENVVEHFQTSFRVNVMQSVYLVRSALPYLNSSQGTIAVMSSASAFLGVPKVSAYVTSKHALQGFFQTLNQEFIMTDTRVTITIMPLPYILTETAVQNWKPVGDSQGLETDDCAARIIHGIPRKKLWYYVDWSVFLVASLYSLWPEIFDLLIRITVYQTSHLFVDVLNII